MEERVEEREETCNGPSSYEHYCQLYEAERGGDYCTGACYGWLDSLSERSSPRHETIDIDKACEGLVWLLARPPASSPPSDEGEGFVLVESLASRLQGDGGATGHGLKAPYGPASLLSQEQVAQLSDWLNSVDTEDFAKYYDPARMQDEGVYPEIWTEEGESALQEYLIPHFLVLKVFFARAAAGGQCILVYFT